MLIRTALIFIVSAMGCARPGMPPVAAPAAPSISEATITPGTGEAIDRYLRAAADLGFSGVVLVAEGPRILLHQGYGYADRDRGIPFHPSTPFGLASVTKTFTAAAVLRLHDIGALDVRDPVAKHLPGWPDDKSAITVHHLLTHTSGLPLDVGIDQGALGREELLTRARATTLTRPPGERWSYSNLGYSLLAAIVEHVADEPFDRFVERELFRLAGMSDSGFSTEGSLHAYCGYRSFQSGCIRSRTAFHEGQVSWNMMGDGGMVSTALDLFRWDRALAAGRVVSGTSQALSISAHAPISATSGFGYGWFVDATPGNRVVHYTGGDGVSAVRYERHIDRPLTVVQFSNNAWGVYRYINAEVSRIARGGTPDSLPVAAAVVPPADLRRYCGTYVTPEGHDVRVQLKNGQLHLPLEGTDAAVIALASGQPHAAAPEQRARAVILTRAVITEAAAGDLTTALRLLPSGADVADERWFWSTFWPTMVTGLGSLQKVEYLGSAPLGEPGSESSDGVQVRLLAHFEHGTHYLRATTTGDGAWTFSPSYQAPLPPGSFHFIPIGRDRFLTRTMPTGVDAELTFNPVGGDVANLRLSTEAGTLSARRQDGCE